MASDYYIFYIYTYSIYKYYNYTCCPKKKNLVTLVSFLVYF